MPANTDAGAFSVRHADPVRLERRGEVSEMRADANSRERLVADALEFHVLVEVHAEHSGVIAAGGHAAVLMAATAGNDVLVVRRGKTDRCGNVIAVRARIGDEVRAHGSARSLFLGI